MHLLHKGFYKLGRHISKFSKPDVPKTCILNQTTNSPPPPAPTEQLHLLCVVWCRANFLLDTLTQRGTLSTFDSLSTGVPLKLKCCLDHNTANDQQMKWRDTICVHSHFSSEHQRLKLIFHCCIDVYLWKLLKSGAFSEHLTSFWLWDASVQGGVLQTSTACGGRFYHYLVFQTIMETNLRFCKCVIESFMTELTCNVCKI